MAEQRSNERVDEHAGEGGTLGAGGGGTNDVTSGAGAGAGIPDAETALRAGEAVTRGDVKKDKEKIFPEAAGTGEARGLPGHAPEEPIPVEKGDGDGI